MKISYNWLKEYLPTGDKFAPYVNNVNKISEILTAVGLEVEAMEKYESVKGGLEGLITAEVITCEQHPNADKLKVTTVNTGTGVLQIVCGAPNVKAGQKVVLALTGTTLYPKDGESFTIKKAKIRGVESNGMICAEDEIGIGKSHDGIIVLPQSTKVGIPASEVFPVYNDYLIEIGLTPNRMDNQSHLGVAKDVCAWLRHHTGHAAEVVTPLGKNFSIDDNSLQFEVAVKDKKLAPRYSGITISNLTIGPSPEWMQNRLKTIGLKPINNVVDITNYILHTTGQPLHAFDADKIKGRKVIVETLTPGTSFVTLDGKERKLTGNDIMICDGNETPMCIAGVFGGMDSGVSESTQNIFLESAVFNSGNIRKSIIGHDLRTDAAVRFEKGVDISKTVEVLKYAATLLKDICGGKISSEIIDIFEAPADRVVTLTFDYLRKLSGRHFERQEVENILTSLGFKIMSADDSSLKLKVPESNPDIALPADVVEEILRISGLDNVEIPKQVKMTPGIHDRTDEFLLEEKISTWLTGNGFSEIFTNSITNDKYFDDASDAIHILNSLSEELTIMRKGMLPTGLEAVAYNLNRQTKDVLFFEFGKTYSGFEGKYHETNHLCFYVTGQFRKVSWNSRAENVSLFFLKGVAKAVFDMVGIQVQEKIIDQQKVSFLVHNRVIGTAEIVSQKLLQKFSIKQPVFYLDLNWDMLRDYASKLKTVYKPVSKFPVMTRDLSVVLKKSITYGEIETLVSSLGIKKLSGMQMFDLYENERLGADKKSIAINFSFADNQKTLTDKEADKMMQQIGNALIENYQAEIRSHA